jgi:hypothetical protein
MHELGRTGAWGAQTRLKGRCKCRMSTWARPRKESSAHCQPPRNIRASPRDRMSAGHAGRCGNAHNVGLDEARSG